MPKRRIHPGIRQRRSRAARQLMRNVSATTDPYAPKFGDTIVLATEMACASCPTEIAEGAEATYIDGELNCSECTWEARHPRG